jgi:hypothetical protein
VRAAIPGLQVTDFSTLKTDYTVLSIACTINVLTTGKGVRCRSASYLRRFEYLFKQLTVLLTHYGWFVFVVSSPTLTSLHRLADDDDDDDGGCDDDDDRNFRIVMAEEQRVLNVLRGKKTSW